MTRFIIFLSLLLAITKVFANEDHPADRVSVNDKGIRTIPGAYIFEFEGREVSIISNIRTNELMTSISGLFRVLRAA
jgi:hypothetical protein